jgi:tetratricopeptide (TPR) repeat protein
MKLTRLVIPVLGLLVTACGSGSPTGAQSSPGSSAPHRLSRETDSVIAQAQARLRASARDWQATDTLAGAYLQKVREVGDPSYYPKAESLLGSALRHDPQDGQALTLMGSLALGRHRFRDAGLWGQKAEGALPGASTPLGILVDAQTQLGQYQAAVDTCQQMVSLKPDLSSYARVSYLRELYGDIPGAIEAMQRAVEAGGPVAENVAYTRALLGTLYFNSARLDEAAAEYHQTLAEDPGYAPALAGLARVRAAQKRFPESIALYEQAVQAYPLPDIVIALGDVYATSGEKGKATRTYDLARAELRLYEANGVDLDAELALFEIDHGGNIAAALSGAERALRDRPNVVTDDVVAWARFRAGNTQGALTASRDSLRLGSRDPLFYYHAGAIENALGMKVEARRDLGMAVSINPNFSLLHQADAMSLLASLGGAS